MAPLLILFFEHILSNTAIGAYPIVGQVLEWGARSDSLRRVARLWIINIAAYCAYPLFHHYLLFLIVFRYSL